MSQSNAERQRQWRERMKQAGYRAMVVWLPPEAVDILGAYPERERGQVILNALRNVTSNTLVTIPGDEKADTGPPAMLNRLEALEGQVAGLTQAVQGLVTGNTLVTIPGNTPVTSQSNDTHQADKAKYQATEPVVTVTQPKATDTVTDTTRRDRALTAEELARSAQSLHKQGLSYAQIAERWENEKIPTLRGGRRWHKGSIHKLAQRYSQ
jgi:hypothetical protein